jgi:hypothetical protein
VSRVLASGAGGKGAEEAGAVHVVLEGLAAVDEDDRDLVVVELAEVGVGVDVDFAPVEGGLGLELGEGVFHDVAEVTAGAGVNDHFVHREIVAGVEVVSGSITTPPMAVML